MRKSGPKTSGRTESAPPPPRSATKRSRLNTTSDKKIRKRPAPVQAPCRQTKRRTKQSDTSSTPAISNVAISSPHNASNNVHKKPTERLVERQPIETKLKIENKTDVAEQNIKEEEEEEEEEEEKKEKKNTDANLTVVQSPSSRASTVDFSWLDGFQIPPAFRPHIDQLSEWVLAALSHSKDLSHCELEGKIGTFSTAHRRFESIVQPKHFNAQLGRCQRAAAGASVFDRTENETTITFLFSNGVRGTQYRDQHSEFVRKRRISNWDVAFGGGTSSPDRQCCVRLSHNVEEPCDAPCEQVKWVRIRKRHSFYYRKVWRFDFTYVRQGATRTEATTAPLQHEIEIEYIGSESDAPQRQSQESMRKKYAQYLVSSLLLKLHDMLALSNDRQPSVLRILQHVVKD